jgi:hypothetical protein
MRQALENAHEALIAVLSRRPAEPESSVSITRNAKGVAQFEVVIRGADADECRTKAGVIFDDLCAVYPYPVTNGEAA